MEILSTNPWVPTEWIEACGFEPRGGGAFAGGAATTLPEGICAFAQAMSGLADAASHTPVIFTTACDQMRRAADAAASRRPEAVFLFNLPATWQTPVARRLYQAEVRRLGEFLARLGGSLPTESGLRAAIQRHETRRQQVREILPRCTARQSAEVLARFFWDGAVVTPQEREGSSVGGVPLAVVGGPLIPAQWPLFEVVEAAGGRVVLNATEPGERCLLPSWSFPAGSESACAALADHYFDHIVDVFQRPNSRLYEWLAPQLVQRGARGILLWVHVGCDLWRAEGAGLREAFGLPLLMLEAHDFHTGDSRDANRLAAFIESLQGAEEGADADAVPNDAKGRVQTAASTAQPRP